jgi:hypothetical protein
MGFQGGHQMRTLFALMIALTSLSIVAPVAQQPERVVDPSRLAGLEWRSLGPAMFGGRVVDVAGVPGNPDLLFVGAASSGLFRSTNGGITFQSIFNDGNTLSIGAIAVQSDSPDVTICRTRATATCLS